MTKCPKCKNPGDGFHICVDLSYKAPGEAKLAKRAPRKLARFENARGMFAGWSDQGSQAYSPETSDA